MDLNKIVEDNMDYALRVLRDLISFNTVLKEYNPDSEEPFGFENRKALEYLLLAGSRLGFDVKNVDNSSKTSK